MQSTTNKDTKTGTLSAGVAADIDLDTSGSKNILVVVENTGGTNAITSVVVKMSPDGTAWGTNTAAGAAFGTIAANSDKPLEMEGVAFQKLRLTLTSTSGTTYRVTIRGT